MGDGLDYSVSLAMRLVLAVPTIALVTVMGFSQSTPHPQSDSEPKWQKVDQVCGELEFATPTKKTIVVDGKTEARLYATPVKDAEVILYRASALDKTCCGSTAPVASTRSNRFGAFKFSGCPRGLYWLRVKRGSFTGAIPLRVTDDFNGKSCRDPSVGRSFVVDAQPPRVETRIY